VFDPNETNPEPFAVIGTDPGGVSVNWELDLDGDTIPDLIGSVHFTNDLGDPEPSADVNQLAGGLDNLDAFITSLPDGTQVVFIAGAAEPPPFDVALTFIMNAGAVDTVSGTGTSPDPDCQGNFEFLDASLQDIGGAYPNLTLNFTLMTMDGNLEGTLTLNGTNQATAAVTLDGAAEVLTYIVNLDTGTVTPA
jgi:hypothetical protein